MNERLEVILAELTPEETRSVLYFAESLLQRRQVLVDSHLARRKVSAWLVHQVGNLLMGGEPEYVSGERPVWRVPVLVTQGRRGHATYVDVDAQAGDLLVTSDTPQKVLADVQAFVAGSPSS
jgi:hypothetical protein